MHPADLLADRIDAAGSPVCVGLDPVHAQLPADVRARHHEPLSAIAEFCRGVIHAIAGRIPAVKLQSACFERYGGKGVALLDECISEAAAAGLFVVLDAKRGDIGISASHYAAGAARAGAHAVTVNGYLGRSGVEPFLEAGLLTFVLVRTSNPDSDAVQGLMLADGRTVAQMMADHTEQLGSARRGTRGLAASGAVVGATKATDAAALRARMPNQVFLIPGYGAQGGTANDIRAMLRPGARTAGDAGVLVTASRSVIYAAVEAGQSWSDAVRASAEKLATEVRTIVTR